METHSGRGIYDLNSPESKKTGEAEDGIEAVLKAKVFLESHPYMKAITDIRKRFGNRMYPGSPALARYLLRPMDQIQLMELHRQEVAHLKKNITGPNVHIHFRDGYEGALALSPPIPRRGIIFIDPSYEIKTEYQSMGAFIEKLHRKWPEATIALWYPMLKAGLHEEMRERLLKFDLKKVLLNEIQFSDPGSAKGLYGSGLLVMNCPYEIEEKIEECRTVMRPFAVN